MMDLAGPVIAIGGLIAFVVVAALLCHWLLEPVNRAAGRLNAPTRFQLTDFIWLMIHLQVLLAVVMQTIAEAMPQRALIVVLGLLSLPIVVLWAASVSVVSRAGILQPRRRAAVILILVPGALAEVMAVPILVVGGIAYLNNEPPGMWQSYSYGTVERTFQLLAIAVAIAAAGFALRWLSFWVMAASPPETTAVQAQ